MPLASERNSVSQSTWQVLMGCFACMAAIGILSLKPPNWTCFQKASYFHLVRLLHQAAFQFLQRAGFHAVRSTWNNPFQLAFYLFMEPGLHPTPAGHRGASQLPRTGCGEHCRSGRDGITQGCAHARLLYFRNDLGAAYCSAQLQVGVGQQAPRAPAVGSPKWAESRFIWRGGRKPTHAPMSRLLQGTSCAMQLSSEHASVLQPAAKRHGMKQCLERPEFGVNPSHPSQQGKLLVFSSPLLGIGRELFCPSPQ